MENDTTTVIAALELVSDPCILVNRELEIEFCNASAKTLLCFNEDPAKFSVLKIWPEAQWIDGDPVVALGEVPATNTPLRIVVKPVSAQCMVAVLTKGSAELLTSQQMNTQRLETLGTIAGGIVHDINNIFTGVLGHVAYLQAILLDQGKHVESLQAIEQGAQRSTALTKQILDYIRAKDDEPISSIDLCALVESSCNLIRGAIPRTCKLYFEVPADAVTVKARENQITQLLINLITNARDAVGVEGEIGIYVEHHVSLHSYGIESDQIHPDGYVLLAVKDNGAGMSEEIAARIFEPYFSTKRDRGTGLGLATVRAIVDTISGFIKVDSVLGEGTTIQVLIPRAEPVAHLSLSNDAQSSHSHLPVAIAGEKLLIIDDEEAVRNVLAMCLEKLGYEVLAAGSPVAGIELYRVHRETISLVILDMVMPELSGDDVFEQLRLIDNQVRVLLCSGYSSRVAVEHVLSNGGKGFIQKPFAIPELAAKVRDCIDSEDSSQTS